jgi:hypothetical protein
MDKQEKNVKFIKLNNGEDLIAEIEDSNDTQFMFKNPMKIIVDTDLETSKQIIFLHPWLPSGVVPPTSIKLPSNVVFLITEVLDDVREYYINMVSEVEMSEMIKKKQKRKKKKIVTSESLETDNVLDFSKLIDRIKKNRPIH